MYSRGLLKTPRYASHMRIISRGCTRSVTLNKDYRLNRLNMTADQLFFIYYTLSYCSDYTQDSADKKIFVQDRVNVPLMNMEEFATAFQCASKKPMNPSERCFFWT
ncbi:hypothetical protein MRX96_026659 [Rhipicephalus microplus]